MTTLERRHSERARIPCNIPVELTDAVRHAQFEADATDLSVGGLSLRAQQLPAIGSQFICTFEAMPGGAQVLGRGEVVWRQPAGQGGGEFGLRFIEVDPKNQALIDEMVAERIARIEAPYRNAKPAEPVLASLEIENITAPVSARLLHTSETEALFEQTLDQFTVGKSVVAHAGASLVRGHIASVQLRMEGSSPRLVLTLEMPRDPARFGEFEWGEPGGDTDPDIFDYAADEHDEISDESLQLAEDEAESFAGLEDDDDVLPAYRRERSRTLSGLGQPDPSSPTGHGSPIFLARGPQTRDSEPEVSEPSGQQQLPFSRAERTTLDERGGLQLDLNQEDEPSAPERVFADEDAIMALLTSPQTPQPSAAGSHAETEGGLPVYHEPSNAPVVRFLRVLARLVETGRGLGERSRELTEQVRAAATQRLSRIPRAPSKPRQVKPAGANTQVIATRGKLDRASWRWIVLGATSIIALGAIMYALVPAASDRYPSHGEVQDQARADGVTGADDEHERHEITNADTMLATGAGHGRVSDINAATSSSTGNKPTPSTTTQFGQRQIKNPKRFLLRMSEPVKLLQGSSDAGGFSVVIADNHALDRAAPIKSGHPAVAKASILNRKDHSAELVVRFVPGRAPAFRVTGHGSAVEVLLEQ